MNWLPDDFEHPQRVDLTTGHHLRPIRAEDVDGALGTDLERAPDELVPRWLAEAWVFEAVHRSP